MLSFTGYTDSVWFSSKKQLPMVIESFSIATRAVSVVMNVYKLVPPNLYLIAPANLALASGEMYEGTRQIVILATEQIKIQTSGGVDFDFTVNNVKP